MTRNPIVTRDSSSATEALQLMVGRHFGHLVRSISPKSYQLVFLFPPFQPVCKEDGSIVGLLHITKVFHEAVDKVEHSSTSSEKPSNALAGVQSELDGITSNP